MIYSDFNAYILIKSLRIFTNYYTLSKIVKFSNNQKFNTIKISSLKKKLKNITSLKSLKNIIKKNQNFNTIKITKHYIIKKKSKL